MDEAASGTTASVVLAKLDRASLYLWVGICAALCNTFLSITWWHPYCDSPGEISGYYAWGFPFPDSELSGTSSMAFHLMPQACLLNLIALAAISFPLIRAIHRRLAQRSGWPLRAMSISGFVLSLLFFAIGHAYMSDLAQVSWTLGSHGDSYWSYRPTAYALANGHKECF